MLHANVFAILTYDIKLFHSDNIANLIKEGAKEINSYEEIKN